MTAPAMYKLLKTVLVDELQCREADVTPAARRADVGLDSLAAVELAVILQSRFALGIADYELLDAVTVGDIAELMASRSDG